LIKYFSTTGFYVLLCIFPNRAQGLQVYGLFWLKQTGTKQERSVFFGKPNFD
jgi:hypothetical protein